MASDRENVFSDEVLKLFTEKMERLFDEIRARIALEYTMNQKDPLRHPKKDVIRAGDVVWYHPRSVTFSVACDEENGTALPEGWGQMIIQADDCSIFEKASDEKRLKTLQAWAVGDRGQGRGRDWRTLTARRQLEVMKLGL